MSGEETGQICTAKLGEGVSNSYIYIYILIILSANREDTRMRRAL